MIPVTNLPLRSHRARGWLAALGMAALLIAAPAVQAQEDGATKILKSMSDYLASQQVISFAFDSDIEIITPEVQKIQFASSGKVLLSRPDKVRASRTGGYADVEFVFDGKTATILGKHMNAFAQLDAPGSIDHLVDLLRDKYGVVMPGADLLLSRVYDELILDVSDAKHIGRGVIDGAECEHLAFRDQDTDWQLWVEVGQRPIPRKYVITSKVVAGAPQYTVRIKDWRTGVQVGANAFEFSPPSGAKQVEITGLPQTDEIPPGVATGGQQ